MKKLVTLLFLTSIFAYSQTDVRFTTVKITNNIQDVLATKVLVQSADFKLNWVLKSSLVGNTNISYVQSTRVLSSSTGTGFIFPLASITQPGLLSSGDKNRLDVELVPYTGATQNLDLGVNGIYANVAGFNDLYVSNGLITSGTIITDDIITGTNVLSTNATDIASKQPQLNGTGFVKATGTTISYDNSTYISSETDPIVKAINGIVKSNGTTINGAVSGTDYVIPSGSVATLTTGRTIGVTGDITYTSPSFNGSSNVTGVGTLATVNSNVGTFGSASTVNTITANGKGLITAVTNDPIAITESQVTNLVSDLAAKQATLISGTHIKTINSSSLVGSGNLNFTKTSVGLSNVDNTSDLNKPISTATQTALNLKQNQLNGTGFVKANGTTITYENIDLFSVQPRNTANSNTVTNSVTETAFTGTAFQFTVASSGLRIGSVVKCTATIIQSSIGSTLNVRSKFGSAGTTTISTTGDRASTVSTNTGGKIELIITIRSVGVSGTASSQLLTTFQENTFTDGSVVPSNGVKTIDTTVANIFGISAQWGTASPTNMITLENIIWEFLY